MWPLVHDKPSQSPPQGSSNSGSPQGPKGELPRLSQTIFMSFKASISFWVSMALVWKMIKARKHETKNTLQLGIASLSLGSEMGRLGLEAHWTIVTI